MDKLKQFTKRYKHVFMTSSLNFEDFVSFRDACIELEFTKTKAFEFLHTHEAKTFNHDLIQYIIEKENDLDLLGSLLLFGAISKLTWELEGDHYDLYLSNLWFVLILNRISKLIQDESKKPIIDQVILRVENEVCIIDRLDGFVEYSNYKGNEKLLSRYEHKALIEEIMLDLSEEHFFRVQTFNTEQIHIRPKNLLEYTFEVRYNDKSVRTLKGIYDYYGLPLDYNSFVKLLDWLYNVRPYFKLFDPNYYLAYRKRSHENMYCSVVFEGSDRPYTYSSDDLSIMVDDLVLVSVGKDDTLKEVKVVDVFYRTDDKIDSRIKPVKRILRKL